MVKTKVSQVFDVLFGEKIKSLLSSSFALGKPMTDIGSSINFKLVIDPAFPEINFSRI
jgi:hypothetical protein